MMTTRSLVMVLAATGGMAVTAANANAAGPCNGPFCNQSSYPKYYSFGAHVMNHFGGGAGGKQAPLPTFQAAPWYLYWPYDAHFLTPAPVSGAFYGPPNAGNFPVNPYFPGAGYGAGYGGGYGYGSMPGGPVPRP